MLIYSHRSEEDNDPLTDVDSAISVPLPSRAGQFRAKPSQARMKHLAISLLSDSDGVDSPTYDGDVESTAGGRIDTQTHRAPLHTHHSTSSTSTLSNPHTVDRSSAPENITPGPSAQNTELFPMAATGDLDVSSILEAPFNPAALTAEDIQSFARKAIEGESARNYRINLPPTDRPVRIYADGVYDLFHFGHALQLRQAKLSFPFVYLMVGVNSDEQVHHHKGRTVMDHTERIEAVQHCRWVDEVILEAPWVIEEDFIHKYQIDYVAHDEAPYLSLGHDDVYSLCKRLGKFLPTRRTPGVSTSELLERIVTKYRKRDFDEKLSRMGHAELRAEGSDYDDLSPRSRVGSPPPTGKPIDVSIPPKPSFSSPYVSRSSSRVISPLASPGGSQTDS